MPATSHDRVALHHANTAGPFKPVGAFIATPRCTVPASTRTTRILDGEPVFALYVPTARHVPGEEHDTDVSEDVAVDAAPTGSGTVAPPCQPEVVRAQVSARVGWAAERAKKPTAMQ